jgi:hypothetical protein
MAHSAGISLAQLWAWNPALNRDFSGLFAGCVYFVSAYGDITSITTTLTEVPPTQTCLEVIVPHLKKCRPEYRAHVASGPYERRRFCFDMAISASISIQILYNLSHTLGRRLSGLWYARYVNLMPWLD